MGTEIHGKIKEEKEKKEVHLEEKKAMGEEFSSLRVDFSDLELQVQKVEQERTNKDHQIRSLSDEIAARDELINKLNKEKKMMQEINSKAVEVFQVADDKVCHLSMVKNKLATAMDDLEDNVDRERRKKGEEDKLRRKVEGDLKIAQESVSDMERQKKELEVAKLRKDLEEISIQQEATTLSLKKKQQDATGEMSEQIDQLGKLKARVEKDNVNIKHEIEEIKVITDEVARAKALSERLGRELNGQLTEMNKKIA